MRSRVPGATSVRPLSTLDTVETETPAWAAIPVRVLRPASRRITQSFRKTDGPEPRHHRREPAPAGPAQVQEKSWKWRVGRPLTQLITRRTLGKFRAAFFRKINGQSNQQRTRDGGHERDSSGRNRRAGRNRGRPARGPIRGKARGAGARDPAGGAPALHAAGRAGR